MEFHTMHRAARRVIAPVALVGALALAAATPAGDNPAAAVAAAAGHPAGHHLHAQASRVHDGLTVVSTLDVEGSARLERECVTDLCSGSWFDGSHSFTFGINGTPFPDRDRNDPAQRTLAAIASTGFAEAAFVRSGGRVARVPGGAHGQVRYRVSAAGGSELTAVVDDASQRVGEVEGSDGSPVASLVASGAPPAVVFGRRSFDRVTIAGEPVMPPAGPLVHVARASEITLLPGPLPLVPCRLAGRDATCLIDTGTSPSALTLAFAERLDREPRGALVIEGLGSYLTGVVDAGPLELGAASLASLHFAVIPHARGAAFDIIVGSDALAGLRVELDPGRHRARVTADDGPESGAGVALDFGAGVPFVNVQLAGRPAESMLVDTGDTATLSIGYDAYREDPGLFTPSGNSQASGVGAQTMASLDGELSRADIGPVHLEGVPVSAVRGQHVGHLGFGIAARCGRLILELARGRIECPGTSAAASSASSTAGQR